MSAKRILPIFTIIATLMIAVDAHKRPNLVPSPLILIPGLGGSRLHARIDKTPEDLSRGPCGKKYSERSKLWLSYDLITPWKMDCWLDNLKLVSKEHFGKSANSPGVDVMVASFGDTAGVEDLSKNRAFPYHYFKEIVNEAMGWGYEKGNTLFAAPYDWRKAPNEHADYFAKLKDLIEETVKRTGVRVSLLAHSNGCMMTLYFLQRQTSAWKKQHIEQFFSVAGAYGGTPKALHGLVSGLDDIFMLPPLKYRDLQRTWPVVYFNLPRPGIGVWGDNEVLLQTPTRNYTALDYKQLFEDINFPEGWERYKAVRDIMSPVQDPDVKVHCLSAEGKPTTSRLIYGRRSNKFPDSQPKTKKEDGDSYIPLRSSSFCETWDKQYTNIIRSAKFDHTYHSGILSNKWFLNYLKGRLFVRHPAGVSLVTLLPLQHPVFQKSHSMFPQH